MEGAVGRWSGKAGSRVRWVVGVGDWEHWVAGGEVFICGWNHGASGAAPVRGGQLTCLA